MRVDLPAFCIVLYLMPFVFWLGYRALHTLQAYRTSHTGFTPKQAYSACHNLLDRIVLRAWDVLPKVSDQSPTYFDRYSVSADGLMIAGATFGGSALVPVTPWDQVSGVGLEMRPLYDYAPATRSYWYQSTRINTGYQFNVLIVLMGGSTVSITMPLRNNDTAVEFVACLLAFARTHERRLNLMGFDKALTRSVVHLEAF